MNDLNNERTSGRIARALRMAGAWGAALQGAGDLGRVAEQMSDVLPARHVRLIRRGVNADDMKLIHASSGAPHGPIAPSVFPALPQAGRVFVLADAEMALVVLHHDRAQCDVFEIGLAQPLTVQDRDLLDLLAVSLADGWSRRQPGLISARIADLTRRNRPRRAVGATAPILDHSNPYALSRSEFRVCAMIGRGFTAKRIARELRLSEATIRSHQRAIYAKTELSGQIEVMFHLQANPTAQSLLNDLPAMAVC